MFKSSFFLIIGLISASFISVGNMDWLTHWLKRSQYGFVVWEPHNFKNLAFRPSWQIALFASRLFIYIYEKFQWKQRWNQTLYQIWYCFWSILHYYVTSAYLWFRRNLEYHEYLNHHTRVYNELEKIYTCWIFQAHWLVQIWYSPLLLELFSRCYFGMNERSCFPTWIRVSPGIHVGFRKHMLPVSNRVGIPFWD